MPTNALEMTFLIKTPLEHEYESISRLLILNSKCDQLH